MPYIIEKTISQTFLKRVKTTPHLVGFQYKDPLPTLGEKKRKWKQITFREFHDECRLISFGLMGLGLKPGDKAAILSNTRYEWALADMAILGTGSITVPIYSSNTSEDVAYILNHSEAKVVIVEDQKQLEKILARRDELKSLVKIVTLDASAMRAAADRKDVLTLDALREIGRREEAKDPTRFEKNLNSARPEDVLTICYTSGTTGIPKGVMLTHDNAISVMEDCVKAIRNFVRPDKEVLITFLPFSHVLGKFESLATYTFGWRESYIESMEQLMANMGEIRPTIMLAVPRIFEKAYAKINATVEEGPLAKKKLFHWAVAAGREYYQAVGAGKLPSPRVYAEYLVAKNLVFSKILDRFGGRLRYAICGGAPLPQEIGQYFQVVGIKILEGYGLTETAAPITVNLPDDIRYGTVGRPLADVSLKIADDGEILTKSRKVFKGYFKMPDETSEVLQDGWFHTGDIGFIDDDGFLHITDRKKDIIVTSAGKNVAPQKIENIAKAEKFISQFVVLGDRRNYLTALITLDREQMIQYANDHQILFSEYPELLRHEKIRSLVQGLVDNVNAKLPSYETIKKFVVLPADFTIDAGELTPSLKVKRGFIAKKYKAELDSLYES